MNIRQAIKNDYDEIYKLVKIAFETAQVSDGDEQDFVYELRQSQRYIPQLELVAQDNKELIAHIMLTKQTVNADKNDIKALLVAPLCVKLEHRSKGIGKILMEESFKIAETLGYNAAFLVGNPEYYKRFGFQSTDKYEIENKTNIPSQYVLCNEIVIGALQKVKGSIDNLA